jgi:Rod binding domain-containing protein
MTPITGASGLLAPALAPNQKPGEDPRRIAAAAEQFEALLIGQMLKSMHESDEGGWTGTDNDDAGAPAMELAEEQLAQTMASHGGLGLSHLIMRGLSAKTQAGADTSATAQKLQP